MSGPHRINRLRGLSAAGAPTTRHTTRKPWRTSREQHHMNRPPYAQQQTRRASSSPRLLPFPPMPQRRRPRFLRVGSPRLICRRPGPLPRARQFRAPASRIGAIWSIPITAPQPPAPAASRAHIRLLGACSFTTTWVALSGPHGVVAGGITQGRRWESVRGRSGTEIQCLAVCKAQRASRL
jgi:hypothetical protein